MNDKQKVIKSNIIDQCKYYNIKYNEHFLNLFVIILSRKVSLKNEISILNMYKDCIKNIIQKKIPNDIVDLIIFYAYPISNCIICKSPKKQKIKYPPKQKWYSKYNLCINAFARNKK